MIEIRKSEDRGHVDHGWLKARHTFSFASYHDPKHVRYRVLRVMNEDTVAPARGFGTHPHDNMEIVTCVLSGELEHKDSMGNGEVLKAGEFQVMTAGSGITHSEFNPSPDNETHLYQIWLFPDEKDLTPHYEQKAFPDEGENRKLQLVAAKGHEQEGALPIHQDVMLYLSNLKAGEEISLPLESARYGWLQLLSGSVTIEESHSLKAGDGASLSEVARPVVKAAEDSRFLFFDLP